ncbi:MAG: hypothetical protein FWG94_07905 [Oscillospiraceae bacterium]|nr:hypothetical protein [Oscillospiraceae bacterium]
MKKLLALFFVLLIFLAGCSRKPGDSVPSQDPTRRPDAPPLQERKAHDTKTPDGAAAFVLDEVIHLDREETEAMIRQHLSIEEVPESYYGILSQVCRRIKYKTGASKIDGNSAEIEVNVTVVDAKKAVYGCMPGALAHLAALQIAGKDVNEPEVVLANYAASNIDWDKMQTIKKDTVLYLVKSRNGEWTPDTNHHGNIEFVNAVSGGAVDLAESLKSIAERFQ